MKEIWKPVKGYTGIYEVSNKGRIYSLITNKILKLINKQGYHKINLFKYNTSKSHVVHRLEAIAFIPNPKKLPEINHKNGIRNCNLIDNLEWCSHLENVRHALKTGLSNGRGLKDGIFEKIQIKSMRDAFKKDYSIRSIAKYFKISYPSMRKILLHQTYKDM